MQPDFLPDMYESGTPNVVGLAGLTAGVRWVLQRGVQAIRAHIECRMIPVPRHISSDCGASVRIRLADMDAVRCAVEAAGIEVEGIQAI